MTREAEKPLAEKVDRGLEDLVLHGIVPEGFEVRLSAAEAVLLHDNRWRVLLDAQVARWEQSMDRADAAGDLGAWHRFKLRRDTLADFAEIHAPKL